MGILSAITKPIAFAAKNLFRGSEGVTAAREALYGTAKNGNPKKFESIFTNFTPKAKAGLGELAKEYKATTGSGVWKSFTAGSKSVGSAIKTGVKDGLAAVAPNAGKFAKVLGGTKGFFKGVGKCLKKMPIIGTIVTFAFEVPEIYSAFKDGGFWEGTKQIFKSGTKLLVGAGLSAVGTAIAGPVGGAVGWLAGDMLMDWLFPPYSAKAEKQNEQQNENPENPSDPAKPADPSNPSNSTNPNNPNNPANPNPVETPTMPQITVPQAPMMTGVPGASGGSGMPCTPCMPMMPTMPMMPGYGFGGGGFGMPYMGSNPFMGGMGGNPFAGGCGFTPIEGNIFEAYPSDYKFRYVGN